MLIHLNVHAHGETVFLSPNLVPINRVTVFEFVLQ